MTGHREFLNKKGVLAAIAKNYNTLQYQPKLVEWLTTVFPEDTFSHLSKFQLHQKLNEILTQHYFGEAQYKYSLFKRFKHQKLVAGFEMKVNNSRIDFITINGHSTSFEIKSTVDNLSKLSKQAGDYVSAFEYNNVIVDEKHLTKCELKLPLSFGIIVFKNQRQIIIRRPLLNVEINAVKQLGLLTKRELLTCFKTCDIALVNKNFDPANINTRFKNALKARYQRRWSFIVKNAENILPIDLQFFFNTNISPSSIYN